MRDKKRKFLWIILIALYFAAAYALLSLFDIPCVFLALFNIPCPGCGMTRALCALLKLELRQALQYNALIFIMPYIAAYLLFDFRHKAHKLFLKFIAVIAIIHWAIKLIVHLF